MRFVKLLPNDFMNASRDLREISTLISLGCDVHVVAKETDENLPHYSFDVIRITSRPLSNFIKSTTINRIVSLFLWTKKVRDLKPNIISCHDILCLLIGWLSTLFSSNKPALVYDSHEFELGRNAKRNRIEILFITYLERFLMKRCAFSIMVADSIADAVKQLHHLDKRPIVVRNIPNYWCLDDNVIKENRNALMNKYNVGSNETLLLYQGVVTTGRGIENAIRALKNIENSRLIVLGNGDKSYLDSLKSLSKDQGVSERMIFLPAVPSEELCHFTGIADIGLLCGENICLSYYYSLPNKLFEYIQGMVPVVGSDLPEIRRIINDYKIGKCCEPSNPNSIAEAVNELRKDKYYNAVKVNLKIAKQDLCWEHEEKILRDAYTDLIKQISK